MKVRIKFSKQGNLRFVGHLDIMRYFQKANRRAELPIAYSEGYSPHQIMSFAAPLGMGLEGLAEYFDIRLTDEAEGQLSSDEAVRRLNAQMAEGMEILSFLRIPDDTKNCMSTVHAADYRAHFLPDKGAPDPLFQGALPTSETEETAAFHWPLLSAGAQQSLSRACASLLQQETIPIVKKGKNGRERELDIRPMIFQLHAEADGLFMRIAQGSEANLKPEFLLNALFQTAEGSIFAAHRNRVVRTELYDDDMNTLESYGERIE